MRWKLFTLVAALTLMVTTSAPPSKVEAQGLVEYALILVLVAIGPEEVLQVHWLRSSKPGNPQAPPSTLGGTVTFTYVVTNTGDSTCTNTFSSSVEVNEGINTLNASISGGEFFINGVPVGFLEPCLTGGNRNAIAVGRPFPPGLSQPEQQRPSVHGFLLNNELTDFSFTVADSNGGTVAAGYPTRLRIARDAERGF